jgi:5-methylcytosine-specific restriction endonuclease McrA
MIDKDLWSAEELEIFELFGYKCANCGMDAVVLHEIIFKSESPRYWADKGNRIPLCRECHELAHGGAKKMMKEKFTLLMELKRVEHT